MTRRLFLMAGMLTVLMATCVAVYADSISYSPNIGNETKSSISPLSTTGLTATSAPGGLRSTATASARIADGVTAQMGGGNGQCSKASGGSGDNGDSDSDSDSDSDNGDSDKNGDSDSDKDSDNGDTDSDGKDSDKDSDDKDTDSDGKDSDKDSDDDDNCPPAPPPGPSPGNNPVPEPATMILLGTGLAGIAANVRKRRKAAKE